MYNAKFIANKLRQKYCLTAGLTERDRESDSGYRLLEKALDVKCFGLAVTYGGYHVAGLGEWFDLLMQATVTWDGLKESLATAHEYHGKTYTRSYLIDSFLNYITAHSAFFVLGDAVNHTQFLFPKRHGGDGSRYALEILLDDGRVLTPVQTREIAFSEDKNTFITVLKNIIPIIESDCICIVVGVIPKKSHAIALRVGVPESGSKYVVMYDSKFSEYYEMRFDVSDKGLGYLFDQMIYDFEMSADGSRFDISFHLAFTKAYEKLDRLDVNHLRIPDGVNQAEVPDYVRSSEYFSMIMSGEGARLVNIVMNDPISVRVIFDHIERDRDNAELLIRQFLHENNVNILISNKVLFLEFFEFVKRINPGLRTFMHLFAISAPLEISDALRALPREKAIDAVKGTILSRDTLGRTWLYYLLASEFNERVRHDSPVLMNISKRAILDVLDCAGGKWELIDALADCCDYERENSECFLNQAMTKFGVSLLFELIKKMLDHETSFSDDFFVYRLCQWIMTDVIMCECIGVARARRFSSPPIANRIEKILRLVAMQRLRMSGGEEFVEPVAARKSIIRAIREALLGSLPTTLNDLCFRLRNALFVSGVGNLKVRKLFDYEQLTLLSICHDPSTYPGMLWLRLLLEFDPYMFVMIFASPLGKGIDFVNAAYGMLQLHTPTRRDGSEKGMSGLEALIRYLINPGMQRSFSTSIDTIYANFSALIRSKPAPGMNELSVVLAFCSVFSKFFDTDMKSLLLTHREYFLSQFIVDLCFMARRAHIKYDDNLKQELADVVAKIINFEACHNANVINIAILLWDNECGYLTSNVFKIVDLSEAEAVDARSKTLIRARPDLDISELTSDREWRMLLCNEYWAQLMGAMLRRNEGAIRSWRTFLLAPLPTSTLFAPRRDSLPDDVIDLSSAVSMKCE